MKGRTASYGLDRSIRANAIGERYDASDLTAPAVRTGADDHRQFPSLVANTRRFSDGRIEAVAKPTAKKPIHG